MIMDPTAPVTGLGAEKTRSAVAPSEIVLLNVLLPPLVRLVKASVEPA
jgi:hypothetical protein